jgi:outer membrane lipoprotein-sorting protein
MTFKAWLPAILACMGLMIATTFAAEPAAPTASTGGPVATGTPVPTATADVADILDKMDAVGKDLKTVHAKFDYEINQTLYEDIQKRKGELWYQAPNQLRFEFTDRPQEAFIFDGRLLFNRKDGTKQLVIWELRRPDEKPVESLELGKTPFPLPFGQRKEEVLKQFTVSRDAKEEAADKDKRTVLELIPKQGTTLAKDYTKVVLWIDTKTFLPTRARLFDPSENITTFDFQGMETNKDLDPKLFARPEIPKDWGDPVMHAKDK